MLYPCKFMEEQDLYPALPKTNLPVECPACGRFRKLDKRGNYPDHSNEVVRMKYPQGNYWTLAGSFWEQKEWYEARND